MTFLIPLALAAAGNSQKGVHRSGLKGEWRVNICKEHMESIESYSPQGPRWRGWKFDITVACRGDQDLCKVVECSCWNSSGGSDPFGPHRQIIAAPVPVQLTRRLLLPRRVAQPSGSARLSIRRSSFALPNWRLM
ncbi:hypothetical protein PM082_019577 [Marasmius tenuissimus]|nr:hypothetical protein PM082_019577 [Marasmius tenuissimus]